MGIAPADLGSRGIGPGFRAEQGTVGVGTAGIHAAGGGHLAVNHQNFPVVAIIRRPRRRQLERIDRIECQQMDAGVAHLVEEGLRRPESAEAVVDHVDLDAVALAGNQEFCKANAEFILVEDIGFQVDVILGRGYRRAHRGDGLRIIVKQRDLVAGDQRAACRRFLQCRQGFDRDVRIAPAPGQQ